MFSNWMLIAAKFRIINRRFLGQHVASYCSKFIPLVSANMESCVPLPLEDKQLHELVEKAKDYLLMHGKDSDHTIHNDHNDNDDMIL